MQKSIFVACLDRVRSLGRPQFDLPDPPIRPCTRIGEWESLPVGRDWDCGDDDDPAALLAGYEGREHVERKPMIVGGR